MISEFVAAVRTYAEEHYNESGWDIVVECYEDAEIAEYIACATTANQAIAIMTERMNIIAEHREDIQSTAF